MILFWKLENKNEKLLWEFLSANSFLDTSLRVRFLCENMISYEGEEGLLLSWKEETEACAAVHISLVKRRDTAASACFVFCESVSL